MAISLLASCDELLSFSPRLFHVVLPSSLHDFLRMGSGSEGEPSRFTLDELDSPPASVSPASVVSSAASTSSSSTCGGCVAKDPILLLAFFHKAIQVELDVLARLVAAGCGDSGVANLRRRFEFLKQVYNYKYYCAAEDEILLFDSRNGRTCLHYATYYGHSDCLQTILTTAQSSHVAASWGFTGLLDNGALVCASTGSFCYPGSTPLHLAARGGSLDCIRKLLALGADRLHRDAAGRIPYISCYEEQQWCLCYPTEPIIRRASCLAITSEVHQRT